MPPFENSLNRAKTSLILFLLKNCERYFLRVILEPSLMSTLICQERVFFALGRNGYQMNISLACSLLKGRERFLLGDPILVFLSPSHLWAHSTCSQS